MAEDKDLEVAEPWSYYSNQHEALGVFLVF